VNEAEAKVRDAQRRIDMRIGNRERCMHEKEMNQRNIEIVMQIADRNRREYEYEIDVLQDQIKLQKETDEEVKLDIELGARHKYTCFTPLDIENAHYPSIKV
jgi:DNA polymerase III delta prime subunit